MTNNTILQMSNHSNKMVKDYLNKSKLDMFYPIL